jgi:hypothetical protein
MSEQEFAYRLIEEFGLTVAPQPVESDGYGGRRGGGWRVIGPGGWAYEVDDVSMREAVVMAIRYAISRKGS